MVTRVVQQTDRYTMLMVLMASWESLAGAGRVGGAGRVRVASATKTSGALRTQSLDRDAAAQMVATATAARLTGAEECRGSHDGAARGKKL